MFNSTEHEITNAHNNWNACMWRFTYFSRWCIFAANTCWNANSCCHLNSYDQAKYQGQLNWAWRKPRNTYFIAVYFSDGVFILLINVKMPTVVGIFTVMSRLNFKPSWDEHEKSFITSRSGFHYYYLFFGVNLGGNFCTEMFHCWLVCMFEY